MIRIDQIRIRLPHSMRTDARGFARELADALARIELHEDVHVAALSLPPLGLEPGMSSRGLAELAARHIQLALEEPRS